MQPPLGVTRCAPVGGFQVRPRWGFSGVPFREPFFVFKEAWNNARNMPPGSSTRDSLIAEGAKAIDKRPTQVLPRASYVTEWLSRQANGHDHSHVLGMTERSPQPIPRMKSSVATSNASRLHGGHTTSAGTLGGASIEAGRAHAEGLEDDCERPRHPTPIS